MDALNYQQDELACFSPTEAYVKWLREELFLGGWHADPTQPCLHYKVYQGVERIPLDRRFPLRSGYTSLKRASGAPAADEANPEQILAWMLYYTHGLTRYQRPAPGGLPTLPESTEAQGPFFPATITGPHPHTHPILGRPVPSGGSLHPTEIYLALGEQWNMPPGIYHYDSFHHALEILREGNYLTDLAALFPAEPVLSSCSAILLLAAFFQKNHQKYTNISYRLQTLDTGIVTEQLRFLTSYFGLTSSVHFQFLDQPLHHLCGLDMQKECIYTALPLRFSHMLDARETNGIQDVTRAEQQSPVASPLLDLPPLELSHRQPFDLLPQSFLLERLYQASLQLTLPSPFIIRTDFVEEQAGEEDNFYLPEMPSDGEHKLASLLLRHRRTSFNAIDTGPLALAELGAILASVNVLDNEIWQVCGCQIYCLASRVEGLPQGVYRYRQERQHLTLLRAESLFSSLGRAGTAPNVGLHLVPVNIFLVGDYVQARAYFGERGLRIMGLVMGQALQRFSLAAATRGLGIHIHLSYRLDIVESELLRLPSSQLAYVGLMLGKARTSQGGLLETNWY